MSYRNLGLAPGEFSLWRGFVMLNTIPMETKYIWGGLQFYRWPSPSYFCKSSPIHTPLQSKARFHRMLGARVLAGLTEYCGIALCLFLPSCEEVKNTGCASPERAAAEPCCWSHPLPAVGAFVSLCLRRTLSPSFCLELLKKTAVHDTPWV